MKVFLIVPLRLFRSKGFNKSLGGWAEFQSTKGWKRGQRSWGCQGKSSFPKTTHDMCHFLCLVYNFKNCCILDINIFWLQIDFILCILSIHVLYHIKWIMFVKGTFSKSIIFKAKSTFEPNVFKLNIKNKFITSNPFSLLIINVKILFNFQNEWCTFDRKKGCLKKIRILHF